MTNLKDLSDPMKVCLTLWAVVGALTLAHQGFLLGQWLAR
jgi:hypothetical protein